MISSTIILEPFSEVGAFEDPSLHTVTTVHKV
jgi:hypothetical protein